MILKMSPRLVTVGPWFVEISTDTAGVKFNADVGSCFVPWTQPTIVWRAAIWVDSPERGIRVKPTLPRRWRRNSQVRCPCGLVSPRMETHAGGTLCRTSQNSAESRQMRACALRCNSLTALDWHRFAIACLLRM